MPKASLEISKPNSREMTAANVKIYQREVAEFSKYVRILESFFHNAASAEQMNELNKFPLNELTELSGYLATNSFNKIISKRDLNTNFENMDRFRLIFIVAQNWLVERYVKLHDDKTIPHSQSALFPKKKSVTIDADFGVACQQLIADKQTLQQLSDDFATKFSIARTDSSSLEWQPKYSITELNASKHTAYFPTDRETLEKVLPKKLFIDCMGKFEPIQQEGVNQTSKVVSGRKSKRQIQVSSDEEDLDEVAEEPVEEGKRKKQQKYPSTTKRPKTKTLEGGKASATAEEANKKESSIESDGFEEESVEEEEEEEEEGEDEGEEEGEEGEEEEEGVKDAEKGVEGKGRKRS